MCQPTYGIPNSLDRLFIQLSQELQGSPRILYAKFFHICTNSNDIFKSL